MLLLPIWVIWGRQDSEFSENINIQFVCFFLNIFKSCARIELKQISTSCLSVSSAASCGFWSIFHFGFIDVFFYCNYVWKEEHEGATLNNELGNSIRAFCWLV